MSETIAGIPPPYRGPMPLPSITSLEIVGQSLSMLRQSLSTRWELWLVAAILFTGTNVVDVVFGSPGNPFHSPLTTASLFVRIVANIWVASAAVRVFTQRGNVWAFNLPLLRYAGAFIGLLALFLVALIFVSHFISHPLIAMVAQDARTKAVASLIVTGICLIGFGIVTVRLSPWLVALATGDSTINIPAAWKGMRRATLAAIGAVIWTAPVPIVHLALTAEAEHLTGTPQLWFTVIDGFVSVLQVLLGMAIASTLYLFVVKYLPRK